MTINHAMAGGRHGGLFGHASPRRGRPVVSGTAAQAAARAAVQYLVREDTLNPEAATTDVVWVPASIGRRAAAFCMDLFLAVAGMCILYGVATWMAPSVSDPAVYPLIIVSYWLLNLWPLARHGQTLGKNIAHIRILTLDNKHAGLGTLFFLRFLVPFLILPVDALSIFRKDRRCIHDQLAKTKVVEAEPVPKE